MPTIGLNWLAASLAVAAVACSSGSSNANAEAGGAPGAGANGAGAGGVSGEGDRGNMSGRPSSGGTEAQGGTGAIGAGAEGLGASAGGGVTNARDAGIPPGCPSTARGQFVPMSTTGAASARSGPTMMWTGTDLLIYDRCGKSTDALYSPCDDRWRPLTWTRSSCALVTVEASPNVYLLGGTPVAATELDGASATSHELSVAGMPTTTLPTAVATSTGVILWGGTTLLADSSGNVASNAGAIYDRGADRWRAMSTVGAPSPRIAPGAWSTGGFVVWGGHSATSIPTDAGRFDCLGDSQPPCSLFQDGAIYDSGADRWTPMSSAGDLPGSRRDHLIAWAGDKVLVWGGYGGAPFAFTRGGALYDTNAKTWTKVPALPDAATVGPAVWTGSRLIMTEGGALQGWAYSPGASGWLAIAALTGVRDCSAPTVSHGALASICTSTSAASMVAALLPDGATSWTSYPVPDTELQQPGVLWNGAELFVWGGNPPPSRNGCPPGVPCDPVEPPSVNSGQLMVP